MNTNSTIKVNFPLYRFVSQLLFKPLTEVVLNPVHFWYLYRVELLECCWEQDYIQFLERCWNQDLELKI